MNEPEITLVGPDGVQREAVIKAYFFDDGGFFGYDDACTLRNDIVRGVNYLRALAKEGETDAAMIIARMWCDEAAALHEELGLSVEAFLAEEEKVKLERLRPPVTEIEKIRPYEDGIEKIRPYDGGIEKIAR